ncbi:MAG: 4'-phosphopantetheinyl transferase [Mariniblastus sp.]
MLQTLTSPNQPFSHHRSTTPEKCAPSTLEAWVQQVCPNTTKHVFTRPLKSNNPKSGRQKEFQLGRAIAEYQLAKLGHPNSTGSIGVNDDRSPNWPLGFVGSISHSKNWIWASVAKTEHLRSIGIDTESIASERTLRQVQREIGTLDEWAIAGDAGLDLVTTFTVVFSAKEAFYKCLYPLEKIFFGFEEAKVVSATNNRIRIRKTSIQKNSNSANNNSDLPTELDVSYLVEGNNVFTATWICQEDNA